MGEGKVEGWLDWKCMLRGQKEFQVVVPGVLLGPQAVLDNGHVVKQMGVEHNVGAVVRAIETGRLDEACLAPDRLQRLGVPNAPWEQLHLDVEDSAEQDLLPAVRAAADWIHAARAKHSVYVHCQMGVSRSATIVIGYLMLKENMTLVDAVSLVKSRRPIVNPNPGFIEQLRKLEVEILHEQAAARRLERQTQVGGEPSGHPGTSRLSFSSLV